MRATHSACEHVKKFEQYISARDGRDFREWSGDRRNGPQSVIDERESNGKLIGFDDSQVWT